MQFSIAPWWVFAQKDTRKKRVSESAKGSPVYYSPIDLIGKKGKKERKTECGGNAGAHNARAGARTRRGAKKGERRARRG